MIDASQINFDGTWLFIAEEDSPGAPRHRGLLIQVSVTAPII